MRATKLAKTRDGSFGIHLPEMFFGSVEAYFKSVFPITLAGVATTGALAGALLAFPQILDGDLGYKDMAIYLLAMTVVGTVALPWYFYALALADKRKISWQEPFVQPGRFYAQAVCSFWLWAAFLLGLRYLLGIPSIVAVVFYAFHGFLLADGAVDKGLAALGMSVRLGQGRRLGLAVIAGLLVFFSLLGASSMGMNEWSLPVRVSAAILGSAVTGSISMIAWAKIYLVLEKDMK